MPNFSERVKRLGFVMVSNILVRGYRNLSGEAFRLYCDLLTYAWQSDLAYVSVRVLAKDLGFKERQTKTRLRELGDAGLIRREGKGGKTSRTWILELAGEELEKYESEYLEKNNKSAPTVQDIAPLTVQDIAPNGAGYCTTTVQDIARKEEKHLRRKERSLKILDEKDFKTEKSDPNFLKHGIDEKRQAELEAKAMSPEDQKKEIAGKDQKAEEQRVKALPRLQAMKDKLKSTPGQAGSKFNFYESEYSKTGS